MMLKQHLPVKLCCLVFGRLVGATDHQSAELRRPPNYDCYLISSYVARRPFLYVDGASCEAARRH